MGIFDSFKNNKNPSSASKSIEDQIPEIVQCYHDFFTDVAKPLKESTDKESNARLMIS